MTFLSIILWQKNQLGPLKVLPQKFIDSSANYEKSLNTTYFSPYKCFHNLFFSLAPLKFHQGIYHHQITCQQPTPRLGWNGLVGMVHQILEWSQVLVFHLSGSKTSEIWRSGDPGKAWYLVLWKKHVYPTTYIAWLFNMGILIIWNLGIGVNKVPEKSDVKNCLQGLKLQVAVAVVTN